MTSRRAAAWVSVLSLLVLAASALPASAAVAFTKRFAHTSTLLADGNILVVGGLSEAFPTGITATNSPVQVLQERKGSILNALDMPVDEAGFTARSSHTATLLPNGTVLVAGGIDNGGSVLSSVIVYDPVLNSWSPAGPVSMSAARYDHTATLLKNGTVLLCGGRKTPSGGGAGGVNSSCDIFAPVGINACAVAGGCISAAAPLSVPRANHTASLLPDGRVFVAGGEDTSGFSVSPFLVTTEIYNPPAALGFGPGAFSTSKNLIQERGYHTATVMGNGKVLIAGGFNTKDDTANKGILQTAEIYDPVSDAIVPAGPMQARKEFHAAVLDTDGSVKVIGGLGNITTTFINASALLTAGSVVTGTFTPTNLQSTMNFTGGVLKLPLAFQLSVPVTGIIHAGEILFSTPQINFGFGRVQFVPGADVPAIAGLRADLAGTLVGCNLQNCGQVTRTFSIPLSAGLGDYIVNPQPVTGKVAALDGTSSIVFAPSPITSTDPPSPITSGSTVLQGTIVVPVPVVFLGATVTNATLSIVSGIVADPSASVLLTGGTMNVGVAPGTVVVSDGAGGAHISLTAHVTSPTGTVQATTAGGATSPIAATGFAMSVVGSLTFVADSVNLANQQFTVDVATVIIRSMAFADIETYNPQSNAWAFGAQGVGLDRFNHTATLTPSGDIRIIGGKDCDPSHANVDCPLVARDLAGTIPLLPGFSGLAGAMRGPRNNHTSTLLPGGSILVAGGSNGPNILNTVELLDPVTGRFSPTGSMRDVRDLHSATLLPNGRVLAAGGFSTNAVSSGSIARAEIYYPDTGVWAPTQPMNAARDNHAAVLLGDGNVLVTGGYASGAYLSSAEIYYSTSGVWRNILPMNTPRALHSATLLQDGRVLVTGGVGTLGVEGSSEIYDPTTGLWGTVTCFDNSGPGPAGAKFCPASAIRTHSHRATLLLDGRVLVTGGNDGFGEQDFSLIYDPVASVWFNTASIGHPLNFKRFNHTATLLPNGAVLIAGGAQALGTSLNKVETFDVPSSSWQQVGSLSTARAYHTMTLSKQGNLLAVGGLSGGTPNNSAESNYFSFFPDNLSVGAPPSQRQSTITAVDLSPFNRGNTITVSGNRFWGLTEASGGGGASANSSHYHPRLVLQAVDGSGGGASQGNSGFVLDLTTRIYSNPNNSWALLNNANGIVNASSMVITMPAAPPGPVLPTPGGTFLPFGWYHLRTGSNAQYSDSVLVQAGPPKPNVGVSTVAATASVFFSSLTWSWSDLKTAFPGMAFDGYNVYSATTGIFVTTIPAATPNFTQTGLLPNTTVQIMVAPYSLTGDGPLGVSATFFTLCSTPTVSAASISSVSFNSLLLTWGTNGNTPGSIYEVSESTDNPSPGGNGQAPFTTSFSTPIPALLQLTTNNVVITGLVLNTTYFFRLRAFNGGGVPSDFSAVVSTRTRSPVSGVVGSPASTTEIDWAWINPGLGPGDFFRVINATSGIVLGTTTVASFKDTGLSTNTPRAIQVSAVTSAGAGPLSPSATVFTLAAVPGFVNPPIINLSSGSFTGDWSANGNPLQTHYHMVVSTSLGGVPIAPSPIDTVNFSADIANLSPAAATFSAQVQAFNGDGVATAFLVLGTTNTLPNPPVNLRVLGTGPSSISVAWDTNNNSSSATYQVTYTTDNFVTTNFVALSFAAHSNQTALVIPNLVTSTTYSIEVQAQNLTGSISAFSNVITTLTFNGGGPPGSLAGVIIAAQPNILSGTIGFNQRAVTLTIPGNTFPSNTFLTISTFAVVPVPGGPCGGANIGIQLLTQPPLQPQGPVFLTLSYTDAELAAAGITTRLGVLNRVDASGTCVPLSTTFDPPNHLFTAEINHFSLFQLAQGVPSSTPDTTLIFPNPFMATRGQAYVTFANMPSTAHVRIFTMRGELVFESYANPAGIMTWPGTNTGGRPVASGVYLAVVQSGSDKKILKLVVLR